MGKKFDQFVEENGLAARWEARGEARGRTEGRVEVARKMVKMGLPAETVISATELEPKKVRQLYKR
jgi:predicted transposase YdaD